MAGLTFGTIITMVLVPTLYATLYRVKSPGSRSVSEAETRVGET